MFDYFYNLWCFGANNFGCKIFAQNFLADALPNHSVVYFYNLAYDACLFSKFNITNSIDKGTRTMSKSFNHNGKHRPLNFAPFLIYH